MHQHTERVCRNLELVVLHCVAALAYHIYQLGTKILFNNTRTRVQYSTSHQVKRYCRCTLYFRLVRLVIDRLLMPRFKLTDTKKSCPSFFVLIDAWSASECKAVNNKKGSSQGLKPWTATRAGGLGYYYWINGHIWVVGKRYSRRRRRRGDDHLGYSLQYIYFFFFFFFFIIAPSRVC